MLWKFDSYIESLLLESQNFIGILGITDREGDIAYAPVYDSGSMTKNGLTYHKTHGHYLRENNRGNPRALDESGLAWRYSSASKTLYYWRPDPPVGDLPILLDVTRQFLSKKGYDSITQKRIMGDSDSFANSHDFV